MGHAVAHGGHCRNAVAAVGVERLYSDGARHIVHRFISVVLVVGHEPGAPRKTNVKVVLNGKIVKCNIPVKNHHGPVPPPGAFREGRVSKVNVHSPATSRCYAVLPSPGDNCVDNVYPPLCFVGKAHDIEALKVLLIRGPDCAVVKRDANRVVPLAVE